MKIREFVALRLAYSVLLFPVLGCAVTNPQRAAIVQFAQASTDIGEFAAAQLPSLRQATIDMNLQDVALAGEAKLSDLDEAFNPDRIAARVAAAHALASYGTLLQALMEETQHEALAAAADDFVNCFKRLSGSRLDDQQVEGLGRLVQTIGGWFVERKKAQALQRIVGAAHDDVNRLCDLLITDFTRTGLGLSQGVDVTIARTKADADLALSRASSSSSDRLVAVKAWALAEMTDAQLDRISAQGREALQRLKSTNTQLSTTMAQRQVSLEELKALGQEMKALTETVRALAG